MMSHETGKVNRRIRWIRGTDIQNCSFVYLCRKPSSVRDASGDVSPSAMHPAMYLHPRCSIFISRQRKRLMIKMP